MSKALLRITTPTFVAGIEHDGKVAPIIRYMKGWTGKEIRDYCIAKGWKLELFIAGQWRTLENGNACENTDTTREGKTGTTAGRSTR